MAEYAIIHTVTRVIRRLTVNGNQAVEHDASVVELGAKLNRQPNVYYVLNADNASVRLATDVEIDAAGVDPIREEAKKKVKVIRFNKAVETLAASPALSPELREFFQAYKDRLT